MSLPTTLPADSQVRKDTPVLSGCIRYAPAALAGMARWSKIGNDKHNPGEPLHHARGKSMDHGDCIVRHLMDIQDIVAAFERNPRAFDPIDPDCMEAKQLMDECDALVWRAALLSQELHERFAGAPLAPGARLPDGPRKVEVTITPVAQTTPAPDNVLLCEGGDYKMWLANTCKCGPCVKADAAGGDSSTFRG